jgi:hypothetical protein
MLNKDQLTQAWASNIYKNREARIVYLNTYLEACYLIENLTEEQVKEICSSVPEIKAFIEPIVTEFEHQLKHYGLTLGYVSQCSAMRYYIRQMLVLKEVVQHIEFTSVIEINILVDNKIAESAYYKGIEHEKVKHVKPQLVEHSQYYPRRG